MEDRVEIVVVGAHLSGLALNHELTSLGGALVGEARTAGDYRLYALPGTVPPKPGLVRDPGHCGPGVPAEIWSLPAGGFGRFVAAIPQPLGVGKIIMDDGRARSGFLCEHWAIADATELHDGWRAFLRSREASPSS